MTSKNRFSLITQILKLANVHIIHTYKELFDVPFGRVIFVCFTDQKNFSCFGQ